MQFCCKKILCCSSKTCSEAVWSDLGIKPLDLRRNKVFGSVMVILIIAF